MSLLWPTSIAICHCYLSNSKHVSVPRYYYIIALSKTEFGVFRLVCCFPSDPSVVLVMSRRSKLLNNLGSSIVITALQDCLENSEIHQCFFWLTPVFQLPPLDTYGENL